MNRAGIADVLLRNAEQHRYELTQLRARVEHLERQLQQADPWQFKRLRYEAPQLS